MPKPAPCWIDPGHAAAAQWWPGCCGSVKACVGGCHTQRMTKLNCGACFAWGHGACSSETHLHGKHFMLTQFDAFMLTHFNAQELPGSHLSRPYWQACCASSLHTADGKQLCATGGQLGLNAVAFIPQQLQLPHPLCSMNARGYHSGRAGEIQLSPRDTTGTGRLKYAAAAAGSDVHQHCRGATGTSSNSAS